MVYGEGFFDLKEKTKGNKIYKCWSNILERCYSERSLTIRDTYQNTSMCEEWKTYSNFKQWYEENYIEGYEIDKDLLSMNQSIYSPTTCVFVPKEINMCINDSKNSTLLGVRYKKKSKDMINEHAKPYCSEISIDNKKKHLGYFPTSFEAHQQWQIAKISYLNDLKLKYENVVDVRVLDSLDIRIKMIENDLINGSITKTINKI